MGNNTPSKNNLLVWEVIVFCILCVWSFADRVIAPNEDVSEVIESSPSENVFLLPTGAERPTIFTTRKPIVVNREISIIGTSGVGGPVDILPIDVVLTGNTTWNDIIRDGDFESMMGVWNQDIIPPDFGDPSYNRIIQENTSALSPTHLALFKGIAGASVSYEISQNFAFSTAVDLDAHIWQDGINLMQITEAVDEITTIPTLFPYGKEPLGALSVRNTLPLLSGLPNTSEIISAYFSFDVMRDVGEIGADDKLEITVRSGRVERGYTEFLIAIPQPLIWFPRGFDVMPILLQYGMGERPFFSVRISKSGRIPIYIDNLRISLQTTFGNFEIPLLCGDFEGPACSPWIGVGDFGIVLDPTGIGNHCLKLGMPPVVSRDVWVELYVRTDRYSGKLTDSLRVLFDEGFLPSAFFVEISPGNFVPMTEYLPQAIPNREEYMRVIARIPSVLTLDEAPHTISIRSSVAPSAEMPESIEENTTVFSVDDIRFLVGTISELRAAEAIYSVPNGDFEHGDDGSWRLTYVIPDISGRGVDDIIVSEGGHNAPFCAKLGGLPPAKLSFYVYPNQVDGSRDYFKVWIGLDESNNGKVVYDTTISGIPSQGGWTQISKWLVPPLLDPSETNFSLHIKGRIRSAQSDSFILFDDFCVSPYGGLGEIVNQYLVCENNAVKNPSFELYPDVDWNKNDIALSMGPIHCFDTAYPETCILPAPAHTGLRAVWLASIPEEPIFSFWTKILDGSEDSSARLEVLVDGQVISLIGSGDQQYWDSYGPVVLNSQIQPFMDGATHTLSFRIVADDCKKPPVRFFVDDVCLGYKLLVPGNDLLCLNPLIGDGGFELGVGTSWSVIPSVGDVVKTGIDAHSGAWYALLKQPEPDIRRLWQENISIPPTAEFLSFYVRVERGTSPSRAKLSVYWDDPMGSPVWSMSGDALDEGEWIEQRVPLPSQFVGAHSLYFVYESCRDLVPTVFMVDNISIGKARFPLIQVEPGGRLCLEKLSLTGGSTGVLNLGGRVKAYRVFIGPSLNKGVEASNDSETLISESVVNGVSAKAVENRGKLVVFQNTIRDNGSGIENYGSGNAVVMCSLVWGNGGYGLFSETDGRLVSGWNMVRPNVVEGVNTVGEITLNPSFVQFLDSPWIGKLVYPIPARVSLDSIVNNYIPDEFKAELSTQLGCTGGVISDFENDVRDLVNLQVSADEVSIAGSEVFWVSCIVSPVVPRAITGRSRNIGIGNNFTVEVGITGPVSLAGAMLYLSPEEYVNKVSNSANPLLVLEGLPGELKQPITLAEGGNQIGRANFVVPYLFFVDSDGEKWTTNGRARLYLRVGSTLIGVGLPDEYRIQFVPADSEFVIDTVPPRLRPDWYDLNISGVVIQSNDSFAPSGAGFPSDWCPYNLAPLAYSSGLLGNQDETIPHIFFNNPEANPLSFTVKCGFYDPYPEDAGEERVVEVSGFLVNQSIQPVVTPQLVSEMLVYGPVFPGFELPLYRGLGCANWEFLNDVYGVLSISPGVQVNYIPYPEGVEGYRSLGVNWEFANLNFGPDWRIRFKFNVRDLAGNQLIETENVQDGINIWWLLSPVLEQLSSTRVGMWTEAPSISWRLKRSASESPDRAGSCYPLFGVRVWSALNPFDYLNSQWVPVGAFSGAGRWGWIKNQTTLDKNTPIYLSDTTYITLNDIISARENCGALLMATVVGADEAGNLQAGYVELSGVRLQSVAEVENLGVPYVIWRNPCGFDIDTKLEVKTWWNRTSGVDPLTYKMLNYNLGERDYGSAGRVPLPSIGDACDYRVEVKLTMTNVLPSEGFAVSNYGFDVQIFEDGKMVASGALTMSGGRTVAELCIPEDLLNLPREEDVGYRLDWYSLVSDFLNMPPKGCAGLRDRLGDEGLPADGFRKREVKYDFVVRAFVQDVGTGAVVLDQTPAKFTLVIYPPRGDLEKGLRGPAFPKEEQKIKIYEREF